MKKEMKPGYQTTEFWITAAAMAGMFFGFPVPPEMAIGVVGFMGSIYVAGRSWIKGAGSK